MTAYENKAPGHPAPAAAGRRPEPVTRLSVVCGVFLAPACSAQRRFRGLDQCAQGRVDGLLIGEMGGDVRGQQDQIRAAAIAREVFASLAALQFREIVFAA